jgi:glutathione peroxidase
MTATIPPNLFDVAISDIDGQQNMLNSIKGNTCLIVNIASKAGYSPRCSNVWSYARTSRQLWELQKLHDMFKDRNFSVIGVPCNQFGGMEPLSNKDISNFIKTNYWFVNFPITEKIDVNGESEHPLYTFLKGPWLRRNNDNMADMSESAKAGQNLANQAMARIPHNWEKFLVSSSGENIGRFSWQEWPLAKEPLTIGSPSTIIDTVRSVVG